MAKRKTKTKNTDHPQVKIDLILPGRKNNLTSASILNALALSYPLRGAWQFAKFPRQEKRECLRVATIGFMVGDYRSE